MKTKIFALIIAILCISLVFVACDEGKPCAEHVNENNDAVCDVCGETVEQPTTEATTSEITTVVETVAPCETHTDEDANKKCDVCGVALVYVPELVAPEEETRVPMVVNPIPEEVTAEHYINVDFEDVAIESLEKLEGTPVYLFDTTANPEIEVRYTEQSEIAPAAYVIWNRITRQVIHTVALSEGSTVTLDFNTFYFAVHTVGNTGSSARFVNYDYAGEQIGEAHEWYDEGEEGTSMLDFMFANIYLTELEVDNGIVYLLDAEGLVYAIELESDKIIHTDDVDTLVKRPSFDYATESIGYIIEDRKVYVYNLDKWIECIMTYDIPGYYDETEAFLLANGDLLIQSIMSLPDEAVSYDLVLGSDKYDIIYTLINVETKQVKTVEFGYVIYDVITIDEEDGIFTDKGHNCFIVNPIYNDRLDTADTKTLIVDNDLTIRLDVTKFLDENRYLIADGLFLGISSYNNSSVDIWNIADVNGNVLVTPPNTADIMTNYILFDGNVYDFGMKLVLDCSAEDGYHIYNYTDKYLVLYKNVETEDGGVVTEYYFYNPTVHEAPQKLADGVEIRRVESELLEVIYKETVDMVETTVVEILNCKNESIMKGESRIFDIDYSVDGALVITMSNGEIYLAK